MPTLTIEFGTVALHIKVWKNAEIAVLVSTRQILDVVLTIGTVPKRNMESVYWFLMPRRKKVTQRRILALVMWYLHVVDHLRCLFGNPEDAYMTSAVANLFEELLKSETCNQKLAPAG